MSTLLGIGLANAVMATALALLAAVVGRVWKKPAFFLAHPKAIAAFERECTWRGVPPVTMNLFGSPVITWRGADHTVASPVIVDRATALPAFPRYERLALRAIGINEFVWLRDEPSSPKSAHQDLPVR